MAEELANDEPIVDEGEAPETETEQPEKVMSEKTKSISEKINKARESERRNVLRELRDVAGTDDLAVIGKMAATLKESSETEVQAVDEYKVINKELNERVKALEETLVQKDIDNVLSNAMSRLKPHSQRAALREFTDDYKVEVENGHTAIFRKGSRVPEQVDGVEADLDQVLNKWAQMDKNKFLFNGGTGSAHIRTGSASTSDPGPEFLADEKNVRALKMSGQYKNFMQGQKVDWQKVKQYQAG